MFIGKSQSVDPSTMKWANEYTRDASSDVQHNYVVDSDADYTSDSNIIPYDQYVEDNEEHVVQSNVSSVRNDALMSILDEMHEQGVQSRLANKPNMVVKDSVTSELARYKELVGEYEKRAKFELTDRERKIDEQMRIIISDRNRKETSLKSELHSAQILLSSTVGHYKSKTEEVTILKKDFKQKEDKFLEEFLDIKRLKEKVEDRLYKQDQSVQTVHMLCKPKSFYDEKNKVAIGYKNPLCLTRAKQVQPALYNGHVLVMSNHARPVVHDSEDTREIAEITRKRMLLKMQSPLCVENKVRIAPPDYSKENLLATFAPQRNLTPEQIFWSIDDNDRKKAETSVLKPISALTVYPPNTPVKLVPRILPTKSQVKINLYVLTQLFTEFDKTCKTRITPTGVTEGERGFEQTKRCYLTEVIPFFKTLKEHFVGVQTALFKEVKVMEEIFDQMNNEVDKNTVDKQCAEIVKKNLLIENENLIANCLSTQLLYDVEKSRCLDLEADMSKVHNESKHISKLEREYLNLQLKYQHLQESFDNKKSHTVQEAPDFNSFFKIKNLEHQIQEKDNVIRNLKVLVANVNDRSCEPYNAKDVTALIEQNDCVRVELEKVKQHYKELYDSIKITRTHTSEKTSTMLNEIESLKAQLRSKESCFTSDYVKPKVLAPGMYAIDVKPIPHPLKNNRSAHLNYISHLKESVETVREIVEEARVVKPLDNALNYACQYTKLSQELLEYVIGTCPKSFNERDNKAPSTPVTRKKQVTFRVNYSNEASGSKPRSNTKKNRILPAKKENKKEVQVGKATGKRFTDIGYQMETHRKEITFKNLMVVLNGDPRERNCALGKCEPKGPQQKWGTDIQTLQDSTVFSNAGGTRVMLWNTGLGLLQTYDGESVQDSSCIFVDLKGILRRRLEHNLFSVGQFCDSDLEVALQKSILALLASTKQSDSAAQNGTELSTKPSRYYEGVGITHQMSVPRTPQQNGVVERRNHTLVEAARTMMIFSKAPMFYGAYAVPLQIHTILRLYGALCKPMRKKENLGKFQAKADIGIFVGYAPSRKGYRIYNKRTRRLMETIHVTFDEMDQTMAPVRISSGPVPVIMTSGQLKSGLAPTDKELEMLFQPMFDEHLEQSPVDEQVPSATEVNAQVVPPGTSLSTTIAQDAPSTSASSSTSDRHLPIQHQEIPEDTPIIHDVPHPSHNLVPGDPGSAQSSSGNVNAVEPNHDNYPPDHIRRWTKDHPLDNIVGNPSRPVSTRKQLATDALWCFYNSVLSKVEPKNFKTVVTEDCWFQAMQEEIHEFD
ncbi:retrovirus-related pol polyprotein from transposon TNT 1-94 [Tanacetum coccineum]